ncbi:MAG: hypothetical protein AAF438_19590, partial [Pseudomonadota bacterium]
RNCRFLSSILRNPKLHETPIPDTIWQSPIVHEISIGLKKLSILSMTQTKWIDLDEPREELSFEQVLEPITSILSK